MPVSGLQEWHSSMPAHPVSMIYATAAANKVHGNWANTTFTGIGQTQLVDYDQMLRLLNMQTYHAVDMRYWVSSGQSAVCQSLLLITKSLHNRSGASRPVT